MRGFLTFHEEQKGDWNMLDLLSNTYVMIGMAVAVIGLGAVLFLNKKGTG